MTGDGAIGETIAPRVRRRAAEGTLVFPGVVALAALAYVAAFIDMPVSEDAGFYGFISKSMFYGSVLHRDMPIATNSLTLYLVAWLFKAAGGPSLIVYRLFYGAAFVALALGVYAWCATFLGRVQACVAALLCTALLPIPYVMLDLGRNQIVVCLVFSVLALRAARSSRRSAPYAVGAFLALASLSRETFIVPSFLIALYYCFAYRRARAPASPRAKLGGVAAGFFALCALGSLDLAFHGTIGRYLLDMTSGAHARYGGGFLSLERLRENANSWAFGASLFYGSVLAIAGFAYAIADPDPDIRFLKYALVPAYLVEGLVVNATESYSVQPMLLFASVLFVWTVFRLSALVTRAQPSARFLVPALVLIACASNATNAVVQYRSYVDIIHGPLEFLRDPYRMLSVTEALPIRRVSTFAEYPLLFLSKEPFAMAYPLLEDLSAGENLGRPALRRDALRILRDDPVDLLADKTSFTFVKKDSDEGRIIDAHYVEIALFDRAKNAPAIAPYRDRLLVSRRFLERAFAPRTPHTEAIADGQVVAAPPETGILSVAVTPQSCAASLTIADGEVLGVFDPASFSTTTISIFHRPGDKLTFSNPGCRSASYRLRDAALRS